MAVGDAVGAVTPVAAGGELVIQPPSGEEWIIHNVFHEGAAALCVTNGAAVCTVDSDTSGGMWAGFFLHVTPSQYLKVVNTDSETRHLGYDGIKSKG